MNKNILGEYVFMY